MICLGDLLFKPIIAAIGNWYEYEEVSDLTARENCGFLEAQGTTTANASGNEPMCIDWETVTQLVRSSVASRCSRFPLVAKSTAAEMVRCQSPINRCLLRARIWRPACTRTSRVPSHLHQPSQLLLLCSRRWPLQRCVIVT